MNRFPLSLTAYVASILLQTALSESWDSLGPGCCGSVSIANKQDHPQKASFDACKQQCITEWGDKCMAIDWFSNTHWCTTLKVSDEARIACTTGWQPGCKAEDGSTVYERNHYVRPVPPPPNPAQTWNKYGDGCCGPVSNANKKDHPQKASFDACKQQCITDWGDNCNAIDWFTKTHWCTTLRRSDEVSHACLDQFDDNCKAQDGSTIWQHGLFPIAVITV